MNHQINQNSGERNIHPDGECDAGPPAMLYAIIFEAVIEGDEDGRHHNGRKNYMRHKNA